MLIKEVVPLISAELLCGEENLDCEVSSACGADLMSDVLAFAREKGLLLTGLVNPQVVRTAEMMDIKCIVFVRGKSPSADIINLAVEKGMTIVKTELAMFSACGMLYQAGLVGGEKF